MNFDISHHTLQPRSHLTSLHRWGFYKRQGKEGSLRSVRGLFNEKQLLYGSMIVQASRTSPSFIIINP